MLRFSNNYIADVLTFDLAADMTGEAPAGFTFLLGDASPPGGGSFSLSVWVIGQRHSRPRKVRFSQRVRSST